MLALLVVLSVKSLPMIMHIYLYICIYMYVYVCFVRKCIWLSNPAYMPQGMPYTVNKTVKMSLHS